MVSLPAVRLAHLAGPGAAPTVAIRAARVPRLRLGDAVTCEHPRLVTDNVVTGCTECDEEWTAVTIASWPEGCAQMYLGVPDGPTCTCGQLYDRSNAQGYWCPGCDRDYAQKESHG